jgi:hypothetical protein
VALETAQFATHPRGLEYVFCPPLYFGIAASARGLLQRLSRRFANGLQRLARRFALLEFVAAQLLDEPLDFSRCLRYRDWFGVLATDKAISEEKWPSEGEQTATHPKHGKVSRGRGDRRGGATTAIGYSVSLVVVSAKLNEDATKWRATE